MRSALRILVPSALLALAALGHAQVVYNQTFTTAPTGWSDNSISTSNGESFLASSANGFGNGTDTLTLTGLAAHGSVTLNFDFYAIQSWDGNGQQGGGADNFRVNADGIAQILTNFANYTGGNTQAYSAATPTGLGGTFAPRTGAYDNGHLGYGTGDFGDSTYRFSITFAHTSSTLALAFTSLQSEAVGNEGWGLDNLSVRITPVPEPATFAALGLGVLPFLRRRARK